MQNNINRALRFGASEVNKLMQKKLDSETAMSLVYRKVAQYFGGTVREAITPEIQWGIDTEAVAIKLLRKIFTSDIYKPEPKAYGEYIMASPDAYTEFFNATIEIKCPNSDTHIKYMQISNNDTMQKICPDYYYQVQTQMLVFGCQRSYFVSFDPRMPLNVGLNRVEILQDPEIHNEIVEKTTYYGKILHNIINKLTKK